MKPLLLWLAFGASLSAPAFASQTAYISVAPIPAVKLSEKGETKVRVNVTVTPGFHIQANPTTQKNLVPTQLTVEAAPGVEVVRVSYPQGKPYRLAGAKEDIQTYEGVVAFELSLKRTGAPLTTKALHGSIRYQACDASVCQFPRSEPVSIPLK